MKKYRNKLIFTSMLSLLPVLMGLLLYKELPAELPIHFAFDGTPDGFARKYMVVFFLPLFMTALHIFSITYMLHDPKKKNIGKKMLGLTFYLIPIISLTVCSAIYIYACGYEINITRMVMIIIGVLFIILGNYMTKNHQNYTIGIKLPWTLNSSENWNKTHRLASRLYAFCGAILILGSVKLLYWLIFVEIVLLLIIPVIYSFILYKKGI